MNRVHHIGNTVENGIIDVPNVPDQGETFIVMMCLMAIIGVSWFIGHRNMVLKAMAENKLPETKSRVVGNFPLRSPNADNAGVFDKTTKKQMEGREKAMKRFVGAAYKLSKQKAIDAVFSTETGDKAKWWNRLYKLKSIFGEDDGRYLPISFALRATDRANNSEFMLSGGVSEMIVESEKDFIDPKTSQTAFKVTLTLHDSNWNNASDKMSPRTVKYIFSQTEKGFGTSVVKGNDGETLPIFVNFVGLRLEKSPVVHDDQVWERFAMEGLGMEVNNKKTDALASVRFHENKGSDVFFIMETIAELHSENIDFNKGVLDERDNTYVHKLHPGNNGEVLPLIVHLGDQIVPVKAVTISGAAETMDLDEPNMIYDIWIRLVTNQVLQLTGPRATRDWKMADPPVSEEQKKKLVKFTVGDPIDLVLLDSANSVMSVDMPEHGKPYYTQFKIKSYTNGISYNVDWYNKMQISIPERPIYDMSLNPKQSVDWTKFGEYEFYAYVWPVVVAIAIIIGSVWQVSSNVAKIARNTGILLKILSLLSTLFVVYMLYTNKKELGVTINYIIPVCGVVTVTTMILALVMNSAIGVPPTRFVVTFMVSVAAICVYYLIFDGWYEYNPETGTEEEQSDFFFLIAVAACITTTLGLGQMGLYLYQAQCAMVKIPITPIKKIGLSLQAVLQVAMTYGLLTIAHNMDDPKDYADELKYAKMMRDSAKDSITKRYFEEEVAIITSKQTDTSEHMVVPSVAGFVLVFGLSSWVYSQTKGTGHERVTRETSVTPKPEGAYMFWVKYMLLMSVLYTTTTKMATELFVSEEDDMCTTKREAMYESLVRSEEKQFGHFDKLRENIAIQLAKHGCVTTSAKPILTSLFLLSLFVPLVSVTGDSYHTTDNNVFYTFIVWAMVSATGSGAIWILDKYKRDTIMTHNPFYIGNTILLK